MRRSTRSATYTTKDHTHRPVPEADTVTFVEWRSKKDAKEGGSSGVE